MKQGQANGDKVSMFEPWLTLDADGNEAIVMLCSCGKGFFMHPDEEIIRCPNCGTWAGNGEVESEE